MRIGWGCLKAGWKDMGFLGQPWYMLMPTGVWEPIPTFGDVNRKAQEMDPCFNLTYETL